MASHERQVDDIKRQRPGTIFLVSLRYPEIFPTELR